jgi:hypothetical protein
MDSINETTSQDNTAATNNKDKDNKYVPNESNYNTTDELLETEKKNNQNDNWNKLDKTMKLNKLNTYADKYGETNGLSTEQISSLKLFFRDATEKGKFQKAKDVVYNKINHEIDDILSLHWNETTRNFTLRNLDTKKVSLLKSLTPKRATSKNNKSSNPTNPVKLYIEDQEDSSS